MSTPNKVEVIKYKAGLAEGDFDVVNVTVGEAIGLIHDLPLAKDLVRTIAADAEAPLARWTGAVQPAAAQAAA